VKVEAFDVCDAILAAAGVRVEDYAKARGIAPSKRIEPLLTAGEMARRLGVGRTTFHSLKKAGMPCLQVKGRLCRFEEKPVLAWLRRRGN